jgi:DNA-binding SARP family transcriptional activator/TolB-like protein/Tfp pilus assembly protein PilF
MRLTTLGLVSLADALGSELSAVTSQPRRVALLAYLTIAEPRGFHSRDTLLGLFWPDYDQQRARNALSQAVHFLRRALGTAAIVSGADDQLRVATELIACDAVLFEEAVNGGRVEEALELYQGPFLEGFHVSAAAPELERWVDGRRSYFARLYARVLEDVAARHEAIGGFAEAVTLRQRLAAQDPLSSRSALALMRTLAAAGEPEAALQHARIHEALLREELSSAPDPAITAFVAELRGRAAKPLLASATSRKIESSSPSTTDSVLAAPPAMNADGTRRRSRVALAIGGALAASLPAILIARGRHTSAEPRIECIAVLPAANLSGDTTLAYFAEAITEATSNSLGKYRVPRVVSPNSALAFRRAAKPLPEIGRLLGCDGIVEESLTRVQNVAHVDARILYAPGDQHLWAGSYERDTAQLVLLERVVVDAVSRHARELAGQIPTELIASRHVEPVAHGLYVNGRNAFRSRNTASLRNAIAYYNQAIGFDSTWALPYAGLADAYGFMISNGYPRPDYLDSARVFADHALRLDSTASEAHASKAGVWLSDGDWSRAEAEYKRAIDLGPNNASAHHWYAMMLAALNRNEEALTRIERARELDPLSQPIFAMRTAIAFLAGVRQSLGNPGSAKSMVDPTHPGTTAGRSLNLAQRGQCKDAYETNEKAQQLAPDNTMILLTLVGVHVLCKNAVAAHSLLEELKRRPDAPFMGVYIASIHAAQRQPDSAFTWLDRTQWGLQAYFELRTNHNLDPLRSDKRFAVLLRRLRMPPDDPVVLAGRPAKH